MSGSVEELKGFLERQARYTESGNEGNGPAALEFRAAAKKLRDAAVLISAQAAEIERLKADHDAALEILAEHHAEIVKLAESDPEFDALQMQRYPKDKYQTGWDKGVLKASAKQYRNAAMLALTENIWLKEDLRKARAALQPAPDGMGEA